MSAAASEAPQRPSLPQVLDATRITLFHSCPRKFYFSEMLHWKPQAESIHLMAGGAIAQALQTAREAFYRDGADAPDAIAAGLVALIRYWGDFDPHPDHVKAQPHVEAAFLRYFERWPLGADNFPPLTLGGKPAIEFSFSFPLPGPPHPETGEPFLYAGRADMIGSFCGQPLIGDEKTSTSFQHFDTKWTMRGQFLGYCHAARINGYETLGVLVRGIQIQKTQTQFLELPIFFDDRKINLWLEQISAHTLPRMVEAWRSGYFERMFSDACTSYTPCAYATPCTSPTPLAWAPNFTRREWNPLAIKKEVA